MLAVLLLFWPRVVAVGRFRQPLSSALLHPLGVTALMAIQWYALFRSWFGRPSVWKGRTYSTAHNEAAAPVVAVAGSKPPK
jgi:hypothetical protein